MILLTGSQGMAGRFLHPWLLERGWQVRDCDREGQPERFGDLRDPEFCARCVAGVRAVVHAAAHPNPHFADTFENNVLSTRNLAVAARQAGVERFIFLSSICANGRAGFGEDVFRTQTVCPSTSGSQTDPTTTTACPNKSAR